MRGRTLTNLIVLLLAFQTRAQDTLPPPMSDHFYFGPVHFASVQDSADFVQFRKGLRWEEAAPTSDTTTIRYRMEWAENLHGGMAMITRGEGSLRLTVENRPLDWFGSRHHYRTADGRRGVLVVHDIPCGLVCRDSWYYVEE